MNSIKVKFAQSAGLVYDVDSQANFDRELDLQVLNKELHVDLKYRRIPINYIVEDAAVLGMSNIILNSAGYASLENIVFNPAVPNKVYDSQESAVTWHSSKDVTFQSRGVIDLDRAVFLGGHRNYGHWLLNHVARLCFLGDAIEDLSFIVPGYLSDKQKDLLRITGLKDENLICLESGITARVAQLTIPQMPWHITNDETAWWSPGALQTLRRRLGLKDTPEKAPDQKVFLTRKNAYWRRLINEDEIFEKYEKMGFRRLEIADLSIAEQIELGQSTKVLMTPAGANSNLFLNMPRDSAVIEFAPPMENMNVSQMFVEATGLRYQQVIGTPTNIGSKALQRDQDYKVDLAQIEKAMAHLSSP